MRSLVSSDELPGSARPRFPTEALVSRTLRTAHSILVLQQCLDNFANPEAAITIVTSLPEINRLVLTYLIRFLQVSNIFWKYFSGCRRIFKTVCEFFSNL